MESTINKIPYMASTPSLTDTNWLLQHSQEMEAWDDACWALIENNSPSHIYLPTGEHVSDAHWRTLAFDSDLERRGARPGDEYKDIYGHWISSFGSVNNFSRLWATRPPGWGNQALVEFVRGVVQIMRGQAFDLALRQYCVGRKFAMTSGGLMGWVPLAAQPGDAVCYFERNQLPFVIRRVGTDGWRLVGDCYVHGMMRGLDAELQDALVTRRIILL